MRKIYMFGIVSAVLLITACTAKIEQTKLSQPTLTRTEAIARAAIVTDITYDQDFTLTNEKDTFLGKVDIAFTWKASPDALKVDFFKGKILKTTFNGKDVQLPYDGLEMTLNSSLRTDGQQHLVVEFEHGYDPEANGMYRFVDPTDKKVYLYSNLEPNYANVIFPCFDQPDMKATFTLRVKAPTDWMVTTSTLPEKVDVAGEQKVWTFPVSPKMATYVWSLNGGPWKVFEDKDSSYPQRLLVRQSMADQVRIEEWFPIARDGMKFYNQFFGTAYPFKKLDFILVPDFNWGGMENIADITETETYLKNGPHTRSEKIHIANVILHEMAHQWFGDLVTTKWWDDLWLNESFASFMADLALPHAGYPNQGFRDFFSDEKAWAYSTDEKVTTHSIAGNKVEDTSAANSDFDGITYGKGASVINQLMYLITEEKFRAGLKDYFDQHANGNAVLADFIGALSKSSGRSLDAWTQQWLKTAGINTFRFEIACEGGKIKKAAAVQTGMKDHPELREQAIQIALLDGKEKLEVKKTVRTTISGERTEIKELVGQNCASVIFPNYEDYGYAKFRMDDRSLENLKASVSRVKDPFIRQMAWNSLWSQVTDGELSVKTFANMWLHEMPKETDDDNLVELLNYASAHSTLSPTILIYYPKDADYKAWRMSVDQMLTTELEKAPAGSDRQMHFVDAFIALATDPASLQKMVAMLDGTFKLPGFDLDQDRRWAVLRHLAENGFDGITARIDTELKRDPSSIGAREALTARVAVPSVEVKRQTLQSLVDQKSEWTFSQKKAVSSHVFPVEQMNLRNQFAQQFFSTLEGFVGKDARSDFFLESYLNLVPIEPGQTKMAQDFLAKHATLPETVSRGLKELVEFSEKYQRAIDKAGSPKQ